MANRPEVIFKGTPFKEAIDVYQSKVRVPTRHYTDLMNKAHSKAFMVAGAMRDDILCDFQEAVGKALTEGATLADFRKDFDQIVKKYGWSYNGTPGWRSRVIYDTNLRTSYSAGHWQQMQATKRMRPYGRYMHGNSRHPREQHLAWDGLVIPLDDPWWNYRCPPNGWGCQCSVVSASEREVRANGWQVFRPETDKTIKVTVNTPDGPMEVETVEGVDPSFAYNPGKAATGMRLSPRRMDEARADGTWKNWRPVPWGNRSRQTWAGLARPERLPVDTPKAKLAAKANTPEELRPILEKMIGGQDALFPTADGSPVLLAVDLLMHIQPGRSPFVPLIPEVLADPFEVWMDFEEHETMGRVELKKRYIKYIETDVKGRGLYLVVQVVKGQLAGWTFVPASSLGVLNNQRRGKLLWSRK